MAPNEMRSDEEGRKVLYPLNILREKFPGLYQVEHAKYNIPESGNTENERKFVPQKLIPTLENAAWGDVIQLTAIHPKDLKQALVDAGFSPKELKFYQIDPNTLDSKNTTIYLYRIDTEDNNPENFVQYDPEKLEAHAVVPDTTKRYYKEKFEQGEGSLLFVGVPHIFHKGPIDVSNFPVISTETDGEPHVST